MKTIKKNGLEFYRKRTYKKPVNGRLTYQYRWRINSQGRIIAASTEGYTKLSGASRNIYSTLAAFGFNVGAYSLADSIIDDAIIEFKKKK